jgi:hypothetical protein
VNDPRGELLDEKILRRALRLESDEHAPVFDPAAIAAAARQRPRLATLSALVALALTGAGAVVVWSTVVVFLPRLVADAFDAALGALVIFAIPATAIADLAQQPVVPLSLIAALAIATAHELRERRVTVAG